MGWLSDIAGLVTAGAGLAKAFGGRKTPRGVAEQTDTARQAALFASAAADPESPTFRKLAALFAEQNRRTSIQAIQGLFKTSRRAKARGDVGFGINPERRDEAIAQALSRNFQLGAERARFEARDTLTGAARATTGAAGAFSYPNYLDVRERDLGIIDRAVGFGGLPKLAAGIERLFQQGPRGWSSQRQPEEFWGEIWNSDPRFTGFT